MFPVFIYFFPSKSPEELRTISTRDLKDYVKMTIPTILVDFPSEATVTEESLEVDNDLLLTENQKERSTTYLRIKLNRLKNKQARFVSHKEFLTCCVSEELVPKGLEVTLEPTIGNHDQEFLDNWYSKQKQFSLSLSLSSIL